MALEDKVNQLEDELKVLKNEIQQTLLEIKEQILLNRYPALHSASEHASSRPKNQEAARPNSADYSKKYKTNTVFLKEEDEADPPADQEPAENDGAWHTSPDPLQPAGPPQYVPGPTPTTATTANGHTPTTANGHAPTTATTANGHAPQPQPQINREASAQLDLLNEENQKIAKESDAIEPPVDKQPEVSVEDDPADDDSRNFNDEMFTVSLGYRLLTWIDTSVMILGREKAAQAIELYARTDEMPAPMKEAILNLIRQSPLKSTSDKAPGIKKIITHLGELNELLDNLSPELLNEVLEVITEANSG